MGMSQCADDARASAIVHNFRPVGLKERKERPPWVKKVNSCHVPLPVPVNHNRRARINTSG
jgi:hypothetical protein